MAFLKRLSNNFLTYISPSKATESPLFAAQQNETVGQKRKRVSSPSAGAGRRKLVKIKEENERVSHVVPRRLGRSSRSPRSPGLGRDEGDVIDTIELNIAKQEDEDVELDGEDEVADEQEDGGLAGDEVMDDDEEDDGVPYDGSTLIDEHTIVLATADDIEASLLTSPRVVSGPEDLGQPHLATTALQEAGWDADYITLMHKVAMRGYEPLLPAYMKFEFRFLPDELFATDDGQAFVSSSEGSQFRAAKEFERVMELSSRVRDRVEMAEHVDLPPSPEAAVRRHLSQYYNFLFADAELGRETRIPLLAMVFGSSGTPASALRATATQRCAALAQRWKEAFSAQSLSSDSHPLPTLYALVVSHTIIALMAYRPEPAARADDDDEDDEDPAPECTGMAIFDLSDVNNAVWDALALACVGCHVRNVMARIAQETGIGARLPGEEKRGNSDVDVDA